MLFADAVFTNGRFTTLDPATPHATALVVQNGRIVCVGSDEGLGAFAGADAPHIDLGGRHVVPGFCDAHLHLFWYGSLLSRQADLTDVPTLDDLLARLSDLSGRTEGYILGRGWDQDKLPDKRYPTRADLDRVSATRPILITRVCGHAAVANSAALARLTPDERALGDADTGLYTETAIAALRRYVPPLSDAEAEDAVRRAMNAALRAGFTSAGTLLDTPDQMGAYHRLRRKGQLPPLRITAHPPHAAATRSLAENGIATGFGDANLRYGGAKLFTDGSLGARTAYLSEPYADAEVGDTSRGTRIYDPDDLKHRCDDAQKKGWQLVIHAIGDAAIRDSLAGIEYALSRGDGDNTQHRHRIEHASILPEYLLERMAARQILAVIQPQFVTSDIWTGERVGATYAADAYPFRRMADAGIPLALSSDSPVERLDPFACLAAAVYRAPWSPEGGLTMIEALHAYCHGGAYAAYAEHERGTLSVGKFADFTVLSGDLFACRDAESVRALRVEAVYIGGEAVTAP